MSFLGLHFPHIPTPREVALKRAAKLIAKYDTNGDKRIGDMERVQKPHRYPATENQILQGDELILVRDVGIVGKKKLNDNFIPENDSNGDGMVSAEELVDNSDNVSAVSVSALVRSYFTQGHWDFQGMHPAADGVSSWEVLSRKQLTPDQLSHVQAKYRYLTVWPASENVLGCHGPRPGEFRGANSSRVGRAPAS